MAKKIKSAKATHSPEYRETAVRLAMSGAKTTAEVARELGLPEWKLYGWVQTWKKKHGAGEQGLNKSAEAQLKELQRRNKELELENEILKKAATYFAKHLS